MPLQNNTLLQNGKYRIVRFIASGGFGCTYEGEFVTLNNTRVAIKEFFFDNMFIRDEKTGKVSVITESKKAVAEKLRKSFMKEAQTVYGMHHDNIVKVLDFFEENGTAYYVMEYIDGMSLNEMLKISGALSEEKALGYIRQVAQALKYVHSQHRLHLDVKPANIMVDKEGKVKLIDFGASKHYDEETKEETSTFKGMNTPGYAPMEQMSSSLTSFTPASDIYALGATLYKLLTDVTPPDAVCLMNGDVSMAPLPDPISPGTRRAVWQSMRPARNDRPQSIEEFLNILDGKVSNEATIVNSEEDNESTKIVARPVSISTGNQTPPPPPPTPQPKPQPKPKPQPRPQPKYKENRRTEKKSNIGIWIIVTLLLIIGIAAVIFLLVKQRDSVSQPKFDTVNEITEYYGEAEVVENEVPNSPEVSNAEQPRITNADQGIKSFGDDSTFNQYAAATGYQVKHATGKFVNSEDKEYYINIDYIILNTGRVYGRYHQHVDLDVNGTFDGSTFNLQLGHGSEESELVLHSKGGNSFSGYWYDSKGNATRASLNI